MSTILCLLFFHLAIKHKHKNLIIIHAISKFKQKQGETSPHKWFQIWWNFIAKHLKFINFTSFFSSFTFDKSRGVSCKTNSQWVVYAFDECWPKHSSSSSSSRLKSNQDGKKQATEKNKINSNKTVNKSSALLLEHLSKSGVFFPLYLQIGFKRLLISFAPNPLKRVCFSFLFNYF